jgi:DNA polymerase-3 subunit gamma/tau
MADGGMCDAETIIDQMAAFGNGSIKEADVIAAYGLASNKQLSDIFTALLASDYKSILNISNELSNSGCDFYHTIGDLEKLIHRQLESISSQSNGQTLTMINILESVSFSKDSVRNGIVGKINFETALFRAIESTKLRYIDELITKLRIASKDTQTHG